MTHLRQPQQPSPRLLVVLLKRIFQVVSENEDLDFLEQLSEILFL